MAERKRNPRAPKNPSAPVPQFARHRSYDELKKTCARRHWSFHDERFRTAGADHVSFSFGGIGAEGQCFYNTFNGRFFGTLTSGEEFHSDDTRNDDQPWFRALMNVVYVPVAKAA